MEEVTAMETNGVSETEEKTDEARAGQLQRSVAAAEQLLATLSEEARVSAMAGTVGEIYEEHCGTVNAAVQRFLHSLEGNALLHAYATTIMLRHEFDADSRMFQWNPAGFYSKLERLHIRMIDYEQEKAELVMQGRIEDEARIVQKILIEMESIPMLEAAEVLERHVMPILKCYPIADILCGHLKMKHQDIKRKLTEVCDKRRKKLLEMEARYLSFDMLTNIKGFVKSQSKSGQLQILIDMPEDKLKDVFVDKWYEWLSELKKGCPMTQEVISVRDIERDAFNVLRERFPDNLSQLLMRTTGSGRQLRQFSIEELHYTTQKPSELPTSVIDALAHQLITEAKTFLDKYLRHPKEYNKSDIYTALTKLQCSPNDKFQVTSMFELDLAMAFSGYVIRQLYDRHNRFLKVNDPVLLLEERWNHYFSVFTVVLKGKDAKTTIQALVDGITHVMITGSTHRKLFFSKFTVINNVLATLAREDNFAKYVEYLKTPQLTIDNYLRALVCGVVEANVGDDGGAVEAVERAVVARLGAQVLGCEARCPFCLEPCRYDDVGHELAALLGTDSPPAHHATRPDCGGHKPAGCVGYRDPRTGRLSTDTCVERIVRSGDLTFANADTGMEEVRYTDYHTIYPDWKIDTAKDDSGEGSYWKWFMCRYNNDLAKLYDAKPAKIPKEWKSLTRKGEIRKLLLK